MNTQTGRLFNVASTCNPSTPIFPPGINLFAKILPSSTKARNLHTYWISHTNKINLLIFPPLTLLSTVHVDDWVFLYTNLKASRDEQKIFKRSTRMAESQTCNCPFCENRRQLFLPLQPLQLVSTEWHFYYPPPFSHDKRLFSSNIWLGLPMKLKGGIIIKVKSQTMEERKKKEEKKKQKKTGEPTKWKSCKNTHAHTQKVLQDTCAIEFNKEHSKQPLHVFFVFFLKFNFENE